MGLSSNENPSSSVLSAAVRGVRAHRHDGHSAFRSFTFSKHLSWNWCLHFVSTMDERNWSGLRHTPHTLWLLLDDDEGVDGSFTTPWLDNDGVVILNIVDAVIVAVDVVDIVIIVLRSGLVGVTTRGIVVGPVVGLTATTSSNWFEISSINWSMVNHVEMSDDCIT